MCGKCPTKQRCFCALKPWGGASPRKKFEPDLVSIVWETSHAGSDPSLGNQVAFWGRHYWQHGVCPKQNDENKWIWSTWWEALTAPVCPRPARKHLLGEIILSSGYRLQGEMSPAKGIVHIQLNNARAQWQPHKQNSQTDCNKTGRNIFATQWWYVRPAAETKGQRASFWGIDSTPYEVCNKNKNEKTRTQTGRQVGRQPKWGDM